jgi:hypothetical protein
MIENLITTTEEIEPAMANLDHLDAVEGADLFGYGNNPD